MNAVADSAPRFVARSRFGLMSEGAHPATRAHRGNFPRTRATFGLVDVAVGLSHRWESMI